MDTGKKRMLRDSLAIGAALFAMFFGAGNMIFPPYLGFQGGTAWISAFFGYYLADVGLAVLSMLALIRVQGAQGLLRPLGRIWSAWMMLAIILCLGPFISIPRTAATTYELSVQPLLGNVSFFPVCALFFLVVCLLSVNESTVVDIVGNILTPILFFGLLFLIGKGVLSPIGPIDTPPRYENMAAQGIAAGYQTMDVLASVVFGGLILNSAAQKGYVKPREQAWTAVSASIVAGIGLLVIYLGLTYLGATAHALGNLRLSRSELLVALIQAILPGDLGLLFFAVVAGMACLTTAIALTSASARYLCGLTGQRVSYRTAVVGVCLFSGVVSSVGVERLVELATPILNVVYPPVLALVVLSFFGPEHSVWFYRLPALLAMLTGGLETLDSSLLSGSPLAKLGFSWLIPAILAAVVGCFLDRKRNRE